MLLTDAWGAHGGIALYNRDVIEAMCLDPTIDQVVALPRVGKLPLAGEIPAKVDFDLSALGGFGAYVSAVMRAMRRGRYDLVYCAHLNLLPLARAVATLLRKPLLLAIYGIDAWEPSTRALSRRLARSADHLMSISQVTLDRFRSWAPYPDAATTLMPNAIHLDQFGLGPKNSELEARYGLAGRKVLMTFGRLAGSERYKGFDAVLDVLPAIIAQRPNVSYVIAGDGNDRGRLEEKARQLGMADYVVFTGMVREEEKADHYRLADVYVMPSLGEGFGFVLLEAMACGVPSIGSTRDGTREAMREGLLGPIVDPFDQQAVVDAVIASLDRPRAIPEGLDYFAFPTFAQRLAAMTSAMMAGA
ncbi:MAG TPA: glycosyltransferase family 4 protein [Sphingomonas sp.]|nr:glycosyltransferase family 4 protein [Sphingomonas sp.]